jgi:hypothetical protein
VCRREDLTVDSDPAAGVEPQSTNLPAFTAQQGLRASFDRFQILLSRGSFFKNCVGFKLYFDFIFQLFDLYLDVVLVCGCSWIVKLGLSGRLSMTPCAIITDFKRVSDNKSRPNCFVCDSQWLRVRVIWAFCVVNYAIC